MTIRWPLVLGIALGLAAIATGFAAGNERIEDWQLAARWTARVGFPLFMITYVASSLAKLWPSPLTRNLWQNRRYWGLGFAASHTIHLYALVTYLRMNAETRTFASLIPGGLAYLFIFAMALTSNDAAMRALGKNWKRLHTVGIHYIWLIFTLAYAGRIGTAATRAEGLIGVTLSLTALSLRIAARRRRVVAA